MPICQMCGIEFPQRGYKPAAFCGKICYRRKHADKARARTKAWTLANAERAKAYREAHYKKADPKFANCPRCNKEFQIYGAQQFCSKACQLQQWNENNPNWRKEDHMRNKAKRNAISMRRYRRTRQNSPWKVLMEMARVRARQKGNPYDLTDEWALARWDGKCELTGIPFTLGLAIRSPFSPSMDQIVPNAGYTQNNTRFILWGLNSLKGTGTNEDMFRIAKALVTNIDYAPLFEESPLFPP